MPQPPDPPRQKPGSCCDPALAGRAGWVRRRVNTPVAGFVPIRLDLPRLLGPTTGRREGHLLSALLVGVELAGAVDWRTDSLDAFAVGRFATAEGLTWRRCARALELLSERGLARTETVQFRPGRFTLTPRCEPASMLHDRGRPAERFVTLARGTLRALGDEHGLSWVARALLALFLLVCDHRSDTLPAGWTKTRLCETFGIGWRRLTQGLADLEAAGLVTHRPRRGGDLSLRLLARAALIVPTMTSVPKRRERRQVARSAATGHGPAAEVAAAVLAHHGLASSPSVPLLRALGEALATGASAHQVTESLCARGSLAGARDPMAVLCARARQLAAVLGDARRSADARRQAEDAARSASAARRQAEDAERDRVEDEGRWIASIAGELPGGTDLGLPQLLASRPVVVAAHIHATCTTLIGRHPDRDPAALVRRWADRPVALSDVDVAGLPARSPRDGPTGSVPRDRQGQTLVERLRADLT